MDNLTHSLCGLLLARTGLDRQGPWATPLLVVAANLPDLEGLAAPLADKATYLMDHRGLSHSFLGGIVGSLLLAGLAWGLGRYVARRRPDWLAQAPRFRPAWALSFLGVGSHLLLDWFNSYGVRLWLPFDGRWYYGDMAFIVDPWMWLLLGAGAVLCVRHTSRWLAVWGVLALLASLVLSWGADIGMVPAEALGLWLVLLAAAMGAKYVLNRREPSPWPARTVLALWTLYLCVLFACSRSAQAKVLAQRGPERPVAEAVSASPQPVVPWRFGVIVSARERVERYAVDLLAGTIEEREALEANLDDPALEALRGSRAWQAWQTFARHPIAERDGDDLVLGDARYRWTDQRPDWSAQRIPLKR